jgi:hypothetical protein
LFGEDFDLVFLLVYRLLELVVAFLVSMLMQKQAGIGHAYHAVHSEEQRCEGQGRSVWGGLVEQ